MMSCSMCGGRLALTDLATAVLQFLVCTLARFRCPVAFALGLATLQICSSARTCISGYENRDMSGSCCPVDSFDRASMQLICIRQLLAVLTRSEGYSWSSCLACTCTLCIATMRWSLFAPKFAQLCTYASVHIRARVHMQSNHSHLHCANMCKTIARKQL